LITSNKVNKNRPRYCKSSHGLA